jgi:hypothetical protein
MTAKHLQALQPIHLNPLSSETDSICEHIYRRVIDNNGNIHERYQQICQNLGIGISEIILK